MCIQENPGWKYTNPLFQSKQFGLTEKRLKIKRNHADFNVVLGEISKVTLSSTVMGDLSQFMVSQDLYLEEISNRAEKLKFPESVV